MERPRDQAFLVLLNEDRGEERIFQLSSQGDRESGWSAKIGIFGGSLFENCCLILPERSWSPRLLRKKVNYSVPFWGEEGEWSWTHVVPASDAVGIGGVPGTGMRPMTAVSLNAFK